MALLVLAVLVPVLLLTLTSPRIDDLRRRQIVAGQLRAIGDAISRYHQSHGEMPSALPDLLIADLLSERDLEIPYELDDPAAQCGFAYVAGLHPNDPPGWPLVFDMQHARDDDCAIMLLLSGDVLSKSRGELAKLMQRFETEYRSSRGDALRVLYGCN